MFPIKRALVSVSDKRGLDALCLGLLPYGIEFLSTGGTARALREFGVRVTDVASYTGEPEILDGRVKTLHPKIHGGLLGRPTQAHQAEMAQHNIDPIDLLVVNLYPFAQTVARSGVTHEEAMENIDIGGPSMLRSAAKNHERVTVIVDPDDYVMLAEEMRKHGGAVSDETRAHLAAKVFAHTAAYDGAIANFLTAPKPGGAFPETLTMQFSHGRPMRYGENPHQKAAFYLSSDVVQPSVGRAEVLQGKELSYNNIVDLDAALGLVSEFERPAATIIKHTNPCGTAEADDCLEAYRMAHGSDSQSAFGGVVAINRPVDDALGQELTQIFLECVIAPRFSDGARAALRAKKSLRLLAYGGEKIGARGNILHSIAGGLLVQTPDDQLVPATNAKVVSQRAPNPDELISLDFCWRVCKHVKSNAIVLGRREGSGARTVGIGAGQMSRVDSVKLARSKAMSPTAGCTLASDAFFPFRDGIDAAAEVGITAIIQPGGSVRDEEVIAAANQHDIALVFTGMRHFNH